MNNNTKSYRKTALKNYGSGKGATTNFSILKTVEGTTELKERNLTITIGNAPRKAQKDNPKVARKNANTGNGMGMIDQLKLFHGKNYKGS